MGATRQDVLSSNATQDHCSFRGHLARYGSSPHTPARRLRLASPRFEAAEGGLLNAASEVFPKAGIYAVRLDGARRINVILVDQGEVEKLAGPTFSGDDRVDDVALPVRF